MNKKGAAVGGLVIAFMGVIVALTLLQIIASGANAVSTTKSYVNSSGNTSGTGQTRYLEGQEIIGTPVVRFTNGTILTATTDYTITEAVRTDTGVKGILYTNVNGFCNTSLVSYTAGLEGYADDSASRTILPLIVIFLAIGIAVWVAWSSGLFESMKDWF
jgi:hypothetical protein